MKQYLQAVVLALAALAIFVCAGWLVWVWAGGGDRLPELLDRGVETTGTVVEVQVSAGSPAAKFELVSPARYFVTYRFVDESGMSHEGRANGITPPFAAAVPGAEIPVRYLPERPEVNAFDAPAFPQRPSPVLMIALLIGVGSMLGWLAVVTVVRRPTSPGSHGSPRRGGTSGQSGPVVRP